MATALHPEIPGLLANQRMLRDSIAARKALAATAAPDFNAVTDSEARRLAEIDARLAELQPAPAPGAKPSAS